LKSGFGNTDQLSRSQCHTHGEKEAFKELKDEPNISLTISYSNDENNGNKIMFPANELAKLKHKKE